MPKKPLNKPTRGEGGKLVPDPEDYLAVERTQGNLPVNATDEQTAERFRLAQAHKLIRLYEHGRLPLDVMRAIDAILQTEHQEPGPKAKGGQ